MAVIHRFDWFGFCFKGAMSRCFGIFLKAKRCLHIKLNSKNSGLVLLLKTVLWHWICLLLSIATNDKVGNRLKLEKLGDFSSFDAMSSNIVLTVSKETVSTKITKTIIVLSSF